MSAFMVDKVHVDLLVKTALVGPSGRPVNPGTAWHKFRWSDVPESALAEMLWSEQRSHWRGVDAYQLGDEQDHTPDTLGAMLTAENLASIHARYPDTLEGGPVPGPLDAYWPEYTYRDPGIRLSAPEALKAVGCFEYQACEHAGWRTSEAFRFCRALEANLIGCVDGYREAPWGWSASDVAERRGMSVVR